MTTDLPVALKLTLEQFIITLQQFSSEAFNKKPAIDSWSAGEVAEHIWIINKNLIHVLQASGEVPDRAPDKKIATIKAALSDRETKRIAPENVKPTGSQQDLAALVAALTRQKEQLYKIVQETDLTQLCTVYPHPALGRLTRLEWLHFIIAHTERHRQQLLHIARQV